MNKLFIFTLSLLTTAYAFCSEKGSYREIEYPKSPEDSELLYDFLAHAEYPLSRDNNTTYQSLKALALHKMTEIDPEKLPVHFGFKLNKDAIEKHISPSTDLTRFQAAINMVFVAHSCARVISSAAGDLWKKDTGPLCLPKENNLPTKRAREYPGNKLERAHTNQNNDRTIVRVNGRIVTIYG